MRAAAFISGGMIPPALRGTRSQVVGHIADWYSTICVLAGVPFADDSPIRPLPKDPTSPGKDIWANGAYPGVDGVDLWPALVTSPQPTNSSAAHPHGLWLSEEVIIFGDMKLVVRDLGTPCPVHGLSAHGVLGGAAWRACALHGNGRDG